MKRGEWHEEARRLRAEGLTHREIGQRLGVTHSAVTKALNPERAREWQQRAEGKPGRRAQKTEWGRAHRPACPACGGLMGHNAVRKGVKACQSCLDAETAKRIAAAIAMRNEKGLSNREISDRMGLSMPAVVSLLSRARRSGVDVARDPYMTRRRELR